MNKNRRNFVKLVLIGAGGVALGKTLSAFGLFGAKDEGYLAEKDFGNFHVSEDHKELIISDEKGKILIIDKD